MGRQSTQYLSIQPTQYTDFFADVKRQLHFIQYDLNLHILQIWEFLSGFSINLVNDLSVRLEHSKWNQLWQVMHCMRSEPSKHFTLQIGHGHVCCQRLIFSKLLLDALLVILINIKCYTGSTNQ